MFEWVGVGRAAALGRPAPHAADLERELGLQRVAAGLHGGFHVMRTKGATSKSARVRPAWPWAMPSFSGSVTMAVFASAHQVAIP